MPRHIGCGSLKQNRAAFSRRAILRFPISIPTKTKIHCGFVCGHPPPRVPLTYPRGGTYIFAYPCRPYFGHTPVT